MFHVSTRSEPHNLMQRLNDPQDKTPRSPLYSLRAKLLLFSLLLVAVPGGVSALIAIHSAGDARLDVVGRQLAEVADGTASEVTELLGRERNKMAAWAH